MEFESNKYQIAYPIIYFWPTAGLPCQKLLTPLLIPTCHARTNALYSSFIHRTGSQKK